MAVLADGRTRADERTEQSLLAIRHREDPYAIDRYLNEVNRLYGVLNKKLAGRDFIAGDYSIADMASYPWIVPYERQGQKIEDFPNLKRWFETIKARPATVQRL